MTSNFKLNIVKFELYKFISSIIEIFIGMNMNKQNCNILENFELQYLKYKKKDFFVLIIFSFFKHNNLIILKNV